MARQRDYQAEYQRRIERGTARGLSRSQARGHPRGGEAPASTRGTASRYDRHLEEGLKAVRGGSSVKAAAKSIHVAPERLRYYLAQTGVAEKQGGRWQIVNDRRPREMSIYSRGQLRQLVLPGYDEAAKAGGYLDAVGKFLDSNDPAHLAPFAGQSVMDIEGIEHPFETRPNVLYRLALTRDESFEMVYRIVA